VFLGIAVLKGFKWIINQCGYATIVPSENDIVYGSVFSLAPADEEKLDGFEGVPVNYVKEHWAVEFSPKDRPENEIGKKGNRPLQASVAGSLDTLVYIDRKRQEESTPNAEYIPRMNHAIADGIACGIPKSYMDRYLRPFIPEPAF